MQLARIPLFLFAAALSVSPLNAQQPIFEEEFGPDPFGEIIELDAEAAEDAATEPPSPPKTPRRRPAVSRPVASASPPPAESLLKRADVAKESAARVRQVLGEPAGQPDRKSDVPLRLVPEEMQLGKVYIVGGKQVRYLALRVWFVNRSADAVTFNRKSLRLVSRGNEIAPGKAPMQQGLMHIQMGRRVASIAELSQPGPVTVPAGEAREVQTIFFNLPGAVDVPEMTLRLAIDDKTAEVNLNDYALGLMRLEIERFGPKGLLGVVTVHGEITSVGIGELVKAFETLVSEKTTRVVLTWAEEAPPLHPDLSSWLVQSATRIGVAPTHEGQHPPLPASLRELHLASIPEDTGVPNYTGRRRIHPTLDEAADAALANAFDAIPLEALIEEIESGGPLTRPAAVAAGSRLPDDRLPLLIKLTSDENPRIASAAVTALRGFGSDEAVDRLVGLARHGEEPLRAAAVRSLAASRFGVAHEALRLLLEASAEGQPVVPPQVLVPVLASHPRPLWGDALFRMAMQGEPAVRAEALAALHKLGHSQLIEAFEAALASDDDSLRSRAFVLLSREQDSASETLAVDFTIHHLESAPPTREMAALLQRTKDPRAIPLLIKHLDAGGSNVSDNVRLLSQIGGLDVRQALEEIYPKLDRTAQQATLVTLAQMNSPKFHEYAAAALQSTDVALIHAAQQQLQSDGDAKAVELLATTLRESKQPHAVQYAATGLAAIGSPEARAALRRAARKDDQRGQRATEALRQLVTSSPGVQAFSAALSAARESKWEEALNQHSLAVELDPQFVEAWAGRANAYMQLKNYDAARENYEKVLKLDPDDTAAITCLGILQVMEGHVEEGLASVRDRAAEFPDDNLYAYNTACLYAVASERIEKDDPPRAEELRADAVKELARAVELGMSEADEVAWMREDPDLKSLHGRPDFEKVVAAAEAQVKKQPMRETPR